MWAGLKNRKAAEYCLERLSAVSTERLGMFFAKFAEFCAKLTEFCEMSLSLLWHTSVKQ